MDRAGTAKRHFSSPDGPRSATGSRRPACGRRRRASRRSGGRIGIGEYSFFLREFVMRKLFRQLIVASMGCLPMASGALAQGAKAALVLQLNSSSPAKLHRLLIHVDLNDPAVMNLALNNATIVIEYYRA